MKKPTRNHNILLALLSLTLVFTTCSAGLASALDLGQGSTLIDPVARVAPSAPDASPRASTPGPRLATGDSFDNSLALHDGANTYEWCFAADQYYNVSVTAGDLLFVSCDNARFTVYTETEAMVSSSTQEFFVEKAPTNATYYLKVSATPTLSAQTTYTFHVVRKSGIGFETAEEITAGVISRYLGWTGSFNNCLYFKFDAEVNQSLTVTPTANDSYFTLQLYDESETPLPTTYVQNVTANATYYLKVTRVARADPSLVLVRFRLLLGVHNTYKDARAVQAGVPVTGQILDAHHPYQWYSVYVPADSAIHACFNLSLFSVKIYSNLTVATGVPLSYTATLANSGSSNLTYYVFVYLADANYYVDNLALSYSFEVRLGESYNQATEINYLRSFGTSASLNTWVSGEISRARPFTVLNFYVESGHDLFFTVQTNASYYYYRPGFALPSAGTYLLDTPVTGNYSLVIHDTTWDKCANKSYRVYAAVSPHADLSTSSEIFAGQQSYVFTEGGPRRVLYKTNVALNRTLKVVQAAGHATTTIRVYDPDETPVAVPIWETTKAGFYYVEVINPGGISTTCTFTVVVATTATDDNPATLPSYAGTWTVPFGSNLPSKRYYLLNVTAGDYLRLHTTTADGQPVPHSASSLTVEVYNGSEATPTTFRATTTAAWRGWRVIRLSHGGPILFEIHGIGTYNVSYYTGADKGTNPYRAEVLRAGGMLRYTYQVWYEDPVLAYETTMAFTVAGLDSEGNPSFYPVAQAAPSAPAGGFPVIYNLDALQQGGYPEVLVNVGELGSRRAYLMDITSNGVVQSRTYIDKRTGVVVAQYTYMEHGYTSWLLQPSWKDAITREYGGDIPGIPVGLLPVMVVFTTLALAWHVKRRKTRDSPRRSR